MTHDEDELRRALEARSAAPSPEFRSRLSQSLGTRPAAPNLMPAIAAVTVLVLTVTSVGVLLAARQLGRSHNAAASGARTESPSPSPVGGSTEVRLAAPSATVVWGLSETGGLYLSIDSGDHWQQRSMPPFPSRYLSFIDDHEGWLLSPGSAATQCQLENATIWHTTDGARTWQKLSGTGIAPSQCKGGIYFVDSKDGWVSASDPNNRPTVYRTVDGGNRWAKSTVPDPAYFKSSAGGFTLQLGWMKHFGASLYVLAFGSQSDPNLPHDNQFILRSDDGGVTWTFVTKATSRSIVMVTATRWLDLSAPGLSSESVNGGQQFHQFATDFNSDAPDGTRFVFADANVGYSSGAGLLQRTVDGGVHWTRLSTPGAVSPSPSPRPSMSPGSIPMPSGTEISAASANIVWALVANRYLFRSTNQGSSWELRSMPSLPPAAQQAVAGGDVLISFVDDVTGWVLYRGSAASGCSQQPVQLWRTTDGAQTWKTVFVAQYGQVSPDGFSLDGCKDVVSFEDAMNGFIEVHASGSQSGIFRTADGGLSWSSYAPLPYPPPGNPQDVVVTSIVGFGTTLLAGAWSANARYAYISTDRGGTWSVAATLPRDAASYVVFLTPSHWLIVQPGEESTDAGQTWHSFTTDYQDAAPVASVFVFADEKVGYGTVRGDLHRTLDGGAHWELIKTSWP